MSRTRATVVDTEVAALAARVTARTIRRWVRDGLLVNHGSDRRQQVDLDAVLDVLDNRDMSAKVCSDRTSAR